MCLSITGVLTIKINSAYTQVVKTLLEHCLCAPRCTLPGSICCPDHPASSTAAFQGKTLASCTDAAHQHGDRTCDTRKRHSVWI